MTIPQHIIHLLMEDITAALCLDNRLRATALLHLGRKQEEQAGFRLLSSAVHSPACFFSSSSSLSLPPFLPAFSSPPLLPLISLWYSLSANGSCLQGGHQIHYQVGQQFPHCFSLALLKLHGGREWRRKGGEQDGAERTGGR